MAGRAESELIAGHGVRRAFGDAVVLSGVDIVIRRREVVALLGGSGSGKSTLLRALAGLDAEAAGTIHRNGRSAVVFQEHRLLPWKRVAANVGLGLTGDVRGRVAAALAEVGLADRQRAWPAELSGGQAQRVAFARALVREPDLLLLDDALVEKLDLDAAHELPKAPWFEPGVSWSVRRVFLHLIAEISQHSGHADILRETIDGQKTMG